MLVSFYHILVFVCIITTYEDKHTSHHTLSASYCSHQTLSSSSTLLTIPYYYHLLFSTLLLSSTLLTIPYHHHLLTISYHHHILFSPHHSIVPFSFNSLSHIAPFYCTISFLSNLSFSYNL